MGLNLVFDLEGDDYLEDVTKVHCIVGADLTTGQEFVFGPNNLTAGLDLLRRADTLIGHNIVEYDIPVLQKLYPAWTLRSTLIDTLCASRTAFAGNTLADEDWGRYSGTVDPDLLKKPHSLEMWGLRLGFRKDQYEGDFAEFNEPMLAYCIQDVRVTRKLFQHLIPEKVNLEVATAETRVAQILWRQHQYGVSFDEGAALELMSRLVEERADLTARLRKVFPPWFAPDGKLTTPKRSQVSKKVGLGEIGYRNVRKGCAFQKIKLVEFNPASGDHIARVLKQRYGWKPTQFTDGGKPKTEAKILEDLPYKEIPLLVRYQNVKKILGYLSEGENAWLSLVKDGRLHGYVRHLGTVTHRMAHYRPNTGNIPTRTALGKECRSLFRATPGKDKVLVGCDASGLQMRGLAHYLAKYDDGAFIKAVTEDDVHDWIRRGTGVYDRENQKTINYAWLFGAGAPKLGVSVLKDLREAKERGAYDGKIPRFGARRRLGRDVMQKMVNYITGLGQMNKQLKRAARRGWLRSLDGRKVPVLSQHRALNTLLMAFEAVVMKYALILADWQLQDLGLLPGVDYEFVLNVHDEWQVETKSQYAETVARTLRWSLAEAGRVLGSRCPLAAKTSIGKTWKETH